MHRRFLVILFLFVLIFSNAGTYFFARLTAKPAEMPAGWAGQENTLEENNIFEEVWGILKNNYIEPLDEEKLWWGAIEGMLGSLDDPQTSFFRPEEMEELIIQTTGSFRGIGVEITEDEGDILIIRVIEGTPADKEGLLPGDRIMEAGSDSLKDVGVEKAASLLRGPKGTKVEIQVQRSGLEKPVSFSIVRDDIDRETVFARLEEERIGYIEIVKFDKNTGKSFQQELSTLETKGLEGLIIDLRNNPGGLLDEAIEVGRNIVPEGVITRVVDRNGEVLNNYLSEAEPRPYPVVVLINEHSASASEIIAGALQDSKGAVLLGQPTYGKATVQHLEDLSDGSGLRYTIAKYQTPDGRDLHQQGLSPDVEVELPEHYSLFYNPVPGKLEPGEASEQAAVLQEMLLLLGYDVEVTGVYNNETVEAVEAFQENSGISSSGLLDTDTREKMRLALKEASVQEDTQLQEAVELLKKKQ